MLIGGKKFDFQNKTYVMGILNVTPDSFSDGGKFSGLDKALKQVEMMIGDGVDTVDIGGMSTRPGHVEISVDEELSRVMPILNAMRERFEIPISIDTYRAEVAKEALMHGAGLINDVWGGIIDGGEMLDLVAKTGVPYCLMHNAKQEVASVSKVVEGLRERVDGAIKAGVKKEQIIIDPGIGFAKGSATNLALVGQINQLEVLGCPILLGASRKSLIGYALDLPVNERLEATLAITAYAYLKARLAVVRVHDVKENVRVLRMLEAIESS